MSFTFKITNNRNGLNTFYYLDTSDSDNTVQTENVSYGYSCLIKPKNSSGRLYIFTSDPSSYGYSPDKLPKMTDPIYFNWVEFTDDGTCVWNNATLVDGTGVPLAMDCQDASGNILYTSGYIASINNIVSGLTSNSSPIVQQAAVITCPADSSVKKVVGPDIHPSAYRPFNQYLTELTTQSTQIVIGSDVVPLENGQSPVVFTGNFGATAPQGQTGMGLLLTSNVINGNTYQVWVPSDQLNSANIYGCGGGTLYFGQMGGNLQLRDQNADNGYALNILSSLPTDFSSYKNSYVLIYASNHPNPDPNPSFAVYFVDAQGNNQKINVTDHSRFNNSPVNLQKVIKFPISVFLSSDDINRLIVTNGGIAPPVRYPYCKIVDSVFRDICTGLNQGYFKPVSGTTTDMNNINFNFRYLTPFAVTLSDNSIAGNLYAKYIRENADPYGFPYADFTALQQAPEQSIINVYIGNDADTNFHYAKRIANSNNAPSVTLSGYPSVHFITGANSNLGRVTVGCVGALSSSSRAYDVCLPYTNDWMPLYFNADDTTGQSSQYVWFKNPLGRQPEIVANVGAQSCLLGVNTPMQFVRNAAGAWQVADAAGNVLGGDIVWNSNVASPVKPTIQASTEVDALPVTPLSPWRVAVNRVTETVRGCDIL